ncbi:hypothetical protein MSG28_015348 [Choristoneura fumiferana]|uniref:Uncharacterized protein n=1 Tax=Choristoneura fumiferana TaxID=7141 RepID=A0ACC0KAT8_CHOFU|nr:hypothetical protein MSG28_015348 [Choristoneura fumiferana]
MVRCSILGCKSDSEKKLPDISFHSFPENPNLHQKWIAATGRTNWTAKKSSKICSRHFEQHELIKKKKITLLLPNAVPSQIKNPAIGDDVVDVMPSTSNQDHIMEIDSAESFTTSLIQQPVNVHQPLIAPIPASTSVAGTNITTKPDATDNIVPSTTVLKHLDIEPDVELSASSVLLSVLPPPSITGNKQKITTKTKTHLPTRLVTVEDQDHNPSKNRSLENKKNIDVCTINVRSLSSAQKLIELKEALTYVKHDIIGLSEVRRLGEKIAEDEDYITYHLGETKGLHGVGFLVKKEYKESIQNFTGISERVCILEILLEKIPFAIIQAYAPTESSTQEEIDSFYGDLEKAHRLISTKNEISMGDFNAQIGTPKPYENKVAGKYGFGNRNKRGEKLIQYAQEHNLKILNTMYKAKHKNRWTWISPDKNTRIMI